VEVPAHVTHQHAPTLTEYASPPVPTGLVLMLHGGKDRGHEVVDERSASWRRSAAMARSISGDLGEAGAAVWLLRYRHRGWNGGLGPVDDARWALQQVRQRLGELPVVLLGHSMGARTSAAVADDPLVRGVVALAPWFPGGESVAPLAGKRLVAAHGSRDHITSPRATRAFVERAAQVGAEATYVDMGRVGHYMLRRIARWNEVARERSLELLG
jgi:predicted esterase